MKSPAHIPGAILLSIFALSPLLIAQSASAPLFSQSFRRGPVQVVEESFAAKLTPQDPVYRQSVKDSAGADRYAFSITPEGPQGDTQITAWQVKLADLRHVIYDNVLMPSQDPTADPLFNPKDALWRLQPSRVSSIPPAAKRIIKVENFYVVLQVKAFHFTPPDSPYLDSMTVQVEFTNTDPRPPAGADKNSERIARVGRTLPSASSGQTLSDLDFAWPIPSVLPERALFNPGPQPTPQPLLLFRVNPCGILYSSRAG